MLEALPVLRGFLSAFGAAEYRADDQVADGYALRHRGVTDALTRQGTTFAALDPFPADEVSEATGRVFRCSHDARLWLAGVLDRARRSADSSDRS